MEPRQDHASLLYRIVNESWRGLNADKFAKRYSSEVSSLEDLVHRVHYQPDGSEIYELRNGFVVLATRNGRWSLWETESRARQRDHERAWGEFSRGFWSAEVPREEGQYFCRDRETGRRSIRELRRANGRLLDVSGGMVGPGRVTEWRGDWFLPKIPSIPGSWS